jgi:hypothetical protein
MASRHPKIRLPDARQWRRDTLRLGFQALSNSVAVPVTNAVASSSTPRVDMTTTLLPPIMAHPGVSPPRRNRLNRSIPGSLLGWRWGWLRGTLPESPVDYRTSKLLEFYLVRSHVTWFRLVSSYVIS